MTINEALRANVIRPGSAADVERFKSRYLAVNQKPMAAGSDGYISMLPIYVITADFTYPEGLHGAHAVTFIIENSAPYPSGDPGHSTVLDMKSGTCLGRMGCR
jgi:transposase InsO family protein